MRKSGVGDTDLWIIAHAAEYGVPYMSHDRGACEVARALGVEVLTALQGRLSRARYVAFSV